MVGAKVRFDVNYFDCKRNVKNGKNIGSTSLVCSNSGKSEQEYRIQAFISDQFSSDGDYFEGYCRLVSGLAASC